MKYHEDDAIIPPLRPNLWQWQTKLFLSFGFAFCILVMGLEGGWSRPNQFSFWANGVLITLIYFFFWGILPRRRPEMTYAWRMLIDRLRSENDPLLPIATLMAKDEVLGQYYPHTSMNALGISKVDIYPFTSGMPYVVPRDGVFDVESRDRKVLGSGSAPEMVEKIKELVA